MKKIILAASAIAIMTGSALASASEGVVAKFNSDVRVITLENGKSYTIPRHIGLPQVQVGDKVTINTKSDDADQVTSVLRAL
ncbi:DUF1344 domain-containing protein [Aminobacter sp. AP02]|uniref:DUF1344 domain-containing protein n=1 Tax=Aminobacter sp. AP02 TaxID=2135737 RepID=UPI000D6AAEF1|nr:DUF1344 domain-containing protein [Aminobacter sp. AP02]PWK67493.1 uncharacterized protein DUF1344 [Aminobacter sp. AP02]